jgi:hypothetical protein
MPQKKQLLRNGITFQLKLGLDAIRDLLLSPVAIVALLIDLFSKKDPADGYFYKLMAWGRFSDHWINLFSDKAPGEYDSNNVDNLLQQIELQVKQQNLTETGIQKITQYLEIVSNKSSKKTKQNCKNE